MLSRARKRVRSSSVRRKRQYPAERLARPEVNDGARPWLFGAALSFNGHVRFAAWLELPGPAKITRREQSHEVENRARRIAAAGEPRYGIQQHVQDAARVIDGELDAGGDGSRVYDGCVGDANERGIKAAVVGGGRDRGCNGPGFRKRCRGAENDRAQVNEGGLAIAKRERADEADTVGRVNADRPRVKRAQCAGCISKMDGAVGKGGPAIERNAVNSDALSGGKAPRLSNGGTREINGEILLGPRLQPPDVRNRAGDQDARCTDESARHVRAGNERRRSIEQYFQPTRAITDGEQEIAGNDGGGENGRVLD